MTEWNSLLTRLIRKLMRRGESEADAEDLVQEASLRVLEYSQEKVVHSIEAFIERTTNNLAIDRHRQRQRYPHENEDIHSLEQRLSLVSPIRSPHEVWAIEERLNEIRGALNELLEGTGDIFVLHRAGFSYKELATAFKLSESTIEKRIARAMLWLMDHKE
jgi:RNA polymerase sigma factor (sigma-70 family)